jgi:beta-phosphoglucomutase-like phosphatase (HAD superfamily)
VSAWRPSSSLAVLLCDADGNLFPSEEPAFIASTDVTNRLLESLSLDVRYTPQELRLRAMGQNFRSTALEIAAEHGLTVEAEELEPWVAEEKAHVTTYLGSALAPDPQVLDPLTRLSRGFSLAAVSSSALSRLDACFRATGLEALFPPAARFSAEDSLPRATSKPDPAVYLHALAELRVEPNEALAVEDAVPGVQSAVGAGIETVGNLVFAPPEERSARRSDLIEAGAGTVVDSWTELQQLLG